MTRVTRVGQPCFVAHAVQRAESAFVPTFPRPRRLSALQRLCPTPRNPLTRISRAPFNRRSASCLWRSLLGCRLGTRAETWSLYILRGGCFKFSCNSNASAADHASYQGMALAVPYGPQLQGFRYLSWSVKRNFCKFCASGSLGWLCLLMRGEGCGQG